MVWGYVVRQDLSKLIEAIEARGSNAGRPAIHPHILFALWLYATLHDMVKTVDPETVMDGVRVLSKEGGKSGTWTRS